MTDGQKFLSYWVPCVSVSRGFSHSVEHFPFGASKVKCDNGSVVLEVDFEPGWYEGLSKYLAADKVSARIAKKEAEYLSPFPPELLKIPTPPTKDAA